MILHRLSFVMGADNPGTEYILTAPLLYLPIIMTHEFEEYIFPRASRIF